MDITIEGFHTWMFKGLSFLLPFLFGGYIFQAYNSYVLYQLSSHPDASWQVSVLSFLFFSLFIGNTLTTLVIVPQKLRGKIKESYRLKSVSWAMKIRQQIKVSFSDSQIEFMHWIIQLLLVSDRVKRLRKFDWANRMMVQMSTQKANRPKINKQLVPFCCVLQHFIKDDGE